MTDLSILDVRLHGRSIGTMTYIGGERSLFAFSDAYIADPARPTLGLRFKDRFGDRITEFRPYKMKLMPFFSNLLPEGHLRHYLAEKAHIHSDREFLLLQALGKDLPGALTVEAMDGALWPPQYDPDSIEDGRAARDAARNALRFSLAGVQLKFSAVADGTGRLTVPARGIGGDWIVKLPSREFAGVPENEFSMMTLARMVGIDTPAIDLVDVGAISNLPRGMENIGPKAFIIERFDRRRDGSSVQIEDFAQVFDVYPDDKYRTASYRNIATVLAAEAGLADSMEFIRRLTFNTLIGNGDMHLKNWSLIYPDDRNARLSPAYDLVSTIPYIPGDQAALNFSRSKDFTAFTADELEHLSAKAALPYRAVLNTARETVALFMERWSSEKLHLPMGSEVRRSIDEHLRGLPIINLMS